MQTDRGPIRTNRLEVSLDRGLYDERYDIFKIETVLKWFSDGAAMLDAPYFKENKSVLSAFFDTSRTFFVLMKKKNSNFGHLKEALDDCVDGDNVIYETVYARDLDDRVLVSLLLNSLSNSEMDYLRFNNLTGHFYCFNPNWTDVAKKRKNAIGQVWCLEFDISKDMDLSLKVKTFTSERLKDEIEFKKGKNFYSYEQYTYGINNTIKRREKSDKGDAFIKRQVRWGRNFVPFLDISDNEKFLSSKMGVLTTVMNLFNRKFSGLCHLDFATIVDYETLPCNREGKEKRAKFIKQVLSGKKINIIDLVKNEASVNLTEKIKAYIEKKYDVSVGEEGDFLEETLNLCIIHNKAYYLGGEDPHDIPHSDICVQHITIEDFKLKNGEVVDASMDASLQNAIVKQDIIDGRISLFDWEAYGIKEKLLFALAKKEDDENDDNNNYRYFFMEIEPDGSFRCFEHKLGRPATELYNKCIGAFGCNKSDIEGLVAFENGDINIIESTGRFTIPEIQKIGEHFAKSNASIRSAAARDEYLVSVTDIRLYEEKGITYYFCGVAGGGMNSSDVKDAPNIRSIIPYDNGKIRFLELLPLMKVFFVRHGQLTVLPFPFKYLREYMYSLQLSS